MIKQVNPLHHSSFLLRSFVVEGRNPQMEFPDDVLCLIREYSRPRMQFIPEYKKVMLDLGMVDWGIVKKRLCDKDAPLVISTLVAYTEAFLTTEKLQTFVEVIPNQEDYLTYQSTLCLHIRHRDTLNRTLQILLVGEETVRNHERWLRYEDLYSDEEY
jgi:hypothetical protein